MYKFFKDNLSAATWQRGTFYTSDALVGLRRDLARNNDIFSRCREFGCSRAWPRMTGPVLAQHISGSRGAVDVLIACK